MAMLPPFFAIIRRLSEEKIKYTVIGGVAAIIYGVPRATFDLDIVLQFSPSNIKRFNRILKEFNLSPLVPINPLELSDKKKRNEWIRKKNAKVINFRDPKNSFNLDVVLIYDYNKLKKIEIEIEGVKFEVIDKNELIRLKSKAGRDIDIRDVKNLKEL